jgi:hypothetical protein
MGRMGLQIGIGCLAEHIVFGSKALIPGLLRVLKSAHRLGFPENGQA